MKNLFLFIGITTIALFVSCSNSDQNNQSTATSIVLTVSSSTVQVNQNVQLTVTNNLTQDVTASSTFYVNNAIITGTVFTPTQAGTYTLYATSGSLVSNEVVITVNDEVVANNSVVVDNVAYTTDQSTLFYLGSYFSDTELDSDGLSYWIAKTYNTTGTIENPEYPNGSWIYFTTLQQLSLIHI